MSSTRRAVHVLDTLHAGRPGVTAATALESDTGIILFDCGPESAFENIVAALRALGRSPEQVRHVFLSHIHLDHAGAAWRFAELGATIYVHPRGAPHLIDPTKLIDSATRIFGAKMESLWGRIAPVPAERIRIANHDEKFSVEGVTIRAFATPGHASHHHVYAWDDAVFAGDVGGVAIAGGPPIPPFVPPELHVERWLESIEMVRGLNPARLYLAHFGLLETPVDAHLDALAERIRRWSEYFRAAIKAGTSEAELIRAFAAYEAEDLRMAGVPVAAAQAYESADPSYMAVGAALRYWTKYHPDQIGRADDQPASSN